MLRKKLYFLQKGVIRKNPLFSRRLKIIQDLQELPEDIVRDQQSNTFVRLVRHAYKFSPFYKDFYDSHGVNMRQIQGATDIKNLPIVSKEMVRSNAKNILTTSAIFCRKAHTSGSSGIPLLLYRDLRSMIEEEAYIWRHRIKFGHQPGDKSVSLRGDLDRSTFKVYDSLARTLHLSNFFLNEKSAERYFKEIIDFKPSAIFAYPSSMEILANFLLDQGKTLHVPVVFTSSETLYDFQKPKIEKVFNTRVVDWYGNAERSIALGESEEGRYDEIPTYSVNEYEADHVISTGLINFSFPLIRYRVDDVVLPSNQKGKIAQIIGKNDDSIILPDGTKIVRLGGPFKGLREIKYAQLVQKSFDKLNINIVPSNNYNRKVIPIIKKKLHRRLGAELALDFNIIDENDIIKTKRGKFKFVISELQEDSIPERINFG